MRFRELQIPRKAGVYRKRERQFEEKIQKNLKRQRYKIIRKRA